jgi:Mor family transcriptional regulator
MNAPLEEIVHAIGIAAALKLVERFCGTRIYLPLPEHIGPDNAVAHVIGVEQARRLAAVWPQERPYIPMARAHLLRERNRQLRLDYASMSASQVARKYRITEWTVYWILRSPDEGGSEPSQQSLF